MSESGINQYTTKIQAKERAPEVNDAGLIDEAKFAAEYAAKNTQLRAVVEKDRNLDAAEKAQMLATVEDVSVKNFAKLSGELDALDVQEKEALRAGIERLNGKAFDLLATMRKTIEKDSEKVLDAAKIAGGISRENFDRHLSSLDNKVEHLAYLHREIDKARVQHGIFEALFGQLQARYEKSIATLTKEVKQEYTNLATLASLTGDRAGERKLRILSDRFGFLQSLKHEGFWTLIGERLTTRDGLMKSWDALKAYTTGIVHGVLSMIHPRTYIMLGEMIGTASASLIFCDDNWAKIQRMIAGAQQAWNQADDNGRAEMLGQFVGSILGAKGVGMATKAGKVAMLNKFKGTVLAADVGVAASGAVAKVSGAVSGVTRVVGKAVPGAVSRAGRAVAGGVAAAGKRVKGVAIETSVNIVSIFVTKLREATQFVTRLTGKVIGGTETKALMQRIEGLNQVGDLPLFSAAKNPVVRTGLAELYDALGVAMKADTTGLLRPVFDRMTKMVEGLRKGKRFVGRAYDVTLEGGAIVLKIFQDRLAATQDFVKRLGVKVVGGPEAKELLRRIDSLDQVDDLPLFSAAENPAVRVGLTQLYTDLGIALKADATGLLKVPFARMTKLLDGMTARGGEVGSWAKELLRNSKVQIGGSLNQAKDTVSLSVRLYIDQLRGVTGSVKRILAKTIGNAEAKDIAQKIEGLNQVGDLPLFSAAENPMVQAGLADLYGSLGTALKASPRGLLRPAFDRMTKMFEGLKKGGGAVGEWAGELLRGTRDTLVISARLYLYDLRGVTNFVKRVTAKTIGNAEAKEILKKIDGLKAVDDLPLFASENPAVLTGLDELYRTLGIALKADKMGVLRPAFDRMTKMFEGLKKGGGVIGEWAKGLLEKGKGFVDLAEGAPGRAPVLSVSAAKVLEGLAGLMDRSGVRQYMPAFGVAAQGEIGPAPQLSDVAVAGEGEKVAPQIQLAKKSDELQGVFKNYEKYDRMDPEKNWKAVNKAVAGLIGVPDYEENSFMSTVKEIQTALKAEPDGTPLDSDGKIGPRTMRTIGAWNVGKNDPESPYHDIALNIDLSKVTPDAVADARGAAKKQNGV